jgi:uncharacterized membrane protein
MHSWHPVAIHLPLITLVLAVGLDLIAAWTRVPRWREAGTWLWWIGLAGAALAVATGLLAYGRVEHSDLAHERMMLHRNLAFASLTVLLASGGWRWRRPYARAAALLGVGGVAGLLAVGYLGGDLVFRHAIGIPTETLEMIMHERGGHDHEHAADAAPSTPSDSGAGGGHAQDHNH